jgi:pimeloyl-ACP methyl ester carboxylesterase
MKTKKLIIFALAAILGGLGTLDSSAQDFAGYWVGKLDAMGQTLKINLDIAKADDTGGYVVRMDVPDQGVKGFRADSASVSGLSLKVRFVQLGIEYEGMMALNSIIGKYRQNGMELPLTFARGEREKAVRPQTPQPPFPYKAEEVEFRNQKAGIVLHGTLTEPDGLGPFPAVVMITGSGTEDRNEEIMEHKPFLVIADYYARRGIAVLRFDDRGWDEATREIAAKSTTEDLSYDAEAALDFLKGRPEISKVGLEGHSEGGMIVFMIAARRPDVAFVVSLAGPSVDGGKILSSQKAAVLEASGAPEEIVKQTIQEQDKINGCIYASDSLPAGIPDDYKSPWLLYFIRHDPAPDIEATQCPALLVSGTKDLQVLQGVNLPVYERIAAGKPSLEIRSMPDLNHLFQHCKTGNPQEYYGISETISPEVLQLTADWILSRQQK